MIARPTPLLLSLAAFLFLAAPLAAAEPSSVEVVLAARKAVWPQKEPWFFDITVKNPSNSPVKVPHVYDAVIEIDGDLYTQFPKPRVSPEPDRLIAQDTETGHGTLTLNGNAFQTVDAKTAKAPLKLAPGEHQLRLILGPHPSKRISFRVAE